MYGDYEAQRHWMEVTYNLPIEQWYVNGTSNDLQYWGLDYPPLTAYHHWVLGAISSKLQPKWIELHESRGHESENHKVFMRLSAIIPFFLFYIPPMIIFFYKIAGVKTPSKGFSPPDKSILFALGVLYPGLLVIDNAHFQYNSISLGLFLLSVCCFTFSRTFLGSLLFTLALNYKQMELYHSLPIFVSILSNIIKTPGFPNIPGIIFRLASVGLIVAGTFVAIWSPFLISGTSLDVLTRVFPFNRGLYEDKVASFWCGFSFILKRLPIQSIQIHLSAASVLVLAAPSLYFLFKNANHKNFRIALFTTSLSFFLFSFHVHEKTILLVAVCAILLLPDYTFDVIWFLNISNISMFSLCVKDGNALVLGLFVAYFVCSTFFWNSFETAIFTRERIWQAVSVMIGFFICGLELYGPVPEQFPHIYQLGNAFYCCVHFIYFLFLFTFRIINFGPEMKQKAQ